MFYFVTTFICELFFCHIDINTMGYSKKDSRTHIYKWRDGREKREKDEEKKSEIEEKGMLRKNGALA